MDNPSAPTISQLLTQFYTQYNLGENGGMADNKVKIEFSKYIYFFFPNWENRRQAVERHDIHHIITKYPSTVKGEAEISTWEVASGCDKYWAAWFLDMQGMMLGLLFPRAIFRSFIRGRRSGNLYHHTVSVADAKNFTPEQLRQKLQIPLADEPLNPTLKETLLFFWWMAIAGLVSLVSLIGVPVIALYNIYVFAGLLFSPAKTNV